MTDKKSILDEDVSLFSGSGDAEIDDYDPISGRKRAKQPEGMFDAGPQTPAEEAAERKRQHDNMKRIGWVFGKIGVMLLIVVGAVLLSVGTFLNSEGHRVDKYLDTHKPQKTRSIKKDVKTLLGVVQTNPRKTKK